MEELLTTNENSPVYVSIGQIPVDDPRYFGVKNKACKKKDEYYFIVNSFKLPMPLARVKRNNCRALWIVGNKMGKAQERIFRK